MSAAQARTDRPYFEVLVVEDMTDEQERSLREELRRWRRPDDPFVYEIVVVPSFDDALMAAQQERYGASDTDNGDDEADPRHPASSTLHSHMVSPARRFITRGAGDTAMDPRPTVGMYACGSRLLTRHYKLRA